MLYKFSFTSIFKSSSVVFLHALSSCLVQALQSLSLADSRLRQRGTVLVNALGSNTCLRKVDLSGNLLEDSGAKMLSKALQINTTLRYMCVCVSVFLLKIGTVMGTKEDFPHRSEHFVPEEDRRSETGGKKQCYRGYVRQVKE